MQRIESYKSLGKSGLAGSGQNPNQGQEADQAEFNLMAPQGPSK